MIASPRRWRIELCASGLWRSMRGRSKACGWAAVLQVGIAFVLFLLPSSQEAYYVFLCVALGFLILCLRSRRDLKLLKLADRQRVDDLPPT